MKQILIVKSGTTLNSGVTTGNDLSGLKDGAITFFNLDDNSLLAATPTKKFGIALGRPNGQLPFIIPEVDFSTLKVTKAVYAAGNKFKGEFTMPTTVAGKEYTIRMFKKGTVPHERNAFTIGIVAKDTSAANAATAMAKAINERVSDIFNVKATVATAKVTIDALDELDWNIVGVDELANTSITLTPFNKAIGDKAYVEDLASRCAAGKGFRDTLPYGHTTMPGYPEPVEDIQYNLYTLRFAVGREAGKTRDERVYQVVHIAVPKPGSGDDIVNAILGNGPAIAVED